MVIRFALIGMVLSGCFYTDEINQRPSLDIQQVSSATVYRGDQIVLRAVANDPENNFVFFSWRAYACTDDGSVDFADCDQAPFPGGEGSNDKFQFDVPIRRLDIDDVPTAVLVLLEGQDEYGATARPVQQLVVGVSDHPPDLTMRKDSRYGYVQDTPVNIFASVGDPDDGPQDVTLMWEVFSPTSNPPYELVDLVVTPDGDLTHDTFGKTFTPKGLGTWEIRVTATDHLGTATTQSEMMIVTPDQPPCLSQLSPLVAVAPSALPISEPTLFQVLVVTDDLNPYPAVPDDPFLQIAATFTWSIKPPGATSRQILSGITGNHVALDPANYQPGDIIELRVEVHDRIARTITCGDDASCSIASLPTCLQRQTWRVEVR